MKNEILPLSQSTKLKTLYPNSCISTVIELIREQANINPDNLALKFGNNYLSYRELEEKSDELALKLRQNGLFNEDKVAVMFPLSLELVVSIYAILKSGGAYVPINATDGKDRIKFILDDLFGRFVLGDSKSLAKVSDLTSATLLEINLFQSDWIRNSRNPLEKFDLLKDESSLLPNINPENLAYIIYTSGTTGRPKGVMVEHRNLNSFILSMRNTWQIDSGDRFLQNPNITFDFSVGTMFMSLCNGSTLVLWEGDLLNVLKEEKITHYLGTPGAALLVDPKNYPNLKGFAVGGEKVPDELISRFSPYCELYDAYGPAECTIIVSMTYLNECKKSHIGTIIPNVDFYVVTPDGQLAAPGESGELWISGDLVARGYLNRPDLTEEKFIENPFGYGRAYKTGDKVKWTNPGIMEYLGRIDRQVKIRGHRLELDEIEKLINGFPGIKSSLAKVINENLVVYVTPENVEIDNLNSYLTDKLPQFAIPSKIISLNNFILNRSGKIDSNSLPDPFKAFNKTGTLPKTDMEKEMAALWKMVLFPNQKTQIFLENNFFDIGGSSLHAIKLIKNINEKLQTELPLEFIYKNSSLKGFVESFQQITKEKPTKNKENAPLKTILIDGLKCLPSLFWFYFTFAAPILFLIVVGFFSPLLAIGIVVLEFLAEKTLGLPQGNILKKIKIFLHFTKFKYKSVKIIEEAPIDTFPRTIFAVSPHGVTEDHLIPLEKLLLARKVKFKVTYAEILFKLPFTKTIYSLLAGIPAKKETYFRAERENISLVVTAGESYEAYYSDEPATIVLKGYLHFFKYALETGTSLTPVFFYNYNKTFSIFKHYHQKRLAILEKNKDSVILPFYGRWFLPIPFKVDLKAVIGTPLHVQKIQNPKWSDVEVVCERYMKHLNDLYQKHKENDAPPLKFL